MDGQIMGKTISLPILSDETKIFLLNTSSEEQLISTFTITKFPSTSPFRCESFWAFYTVILSIIHLVVAPTTSFTDL